MDKRLASLLDLVKNTGDRLVVLDAEGASEPFVIMDLPSYKKLVDGGAQAQPVPSVKQDEQTMSSDLALWERTKQELQTPQTEALSTPEVASESEPTEGEKYYFEAIDEEES